MDLQNIMNQSIADTYAQLKDVYTSLSSMEGNEIDLEKCVLHMKTLHAINGSTKQSDEPELQTPCTSVPSDGMKDDLAEEDLLEDEASRECKKARVEEPLLPPTVQVNQEVDVAVAAGGIPRIEKDCKFNLAILHCSVCYDRLMPPVFHCVACLHSACATCQEKLPGKRCH